MSRCRGRHRIPPLRTRVASFGTLPSALSLPTSLSSSVVERISASRPWNFDTMCPETKSTNEASSSSFSARGVSLNLVFHEGNRDPCAMNRFRKSNLPCFWIPRITSDKASRKRLSANSGSRSLDSQEMRGVRRRGWGIQRHQEEVAFEPKS